MQPIPKQVARLMTHMPTEPLDCNHMRWSLHVSLAEVHALASMGELVVQEAGECQNLVRLSRGQGLTTGECSSGFRLELSRTVPISAEGLTWPLLSHSISAHLEQVILTNAWLSSDGL